MADTTVPAPFADNLELVLRKYGKIWIWSILCTAAAGLSIRSIYSGVALLPGIMGSIGGPMRTIPAIVSIYSLLGLFSPAITVVAVYYLLQFLKWHLLPMLFPGLAPAEPSGEPVTSFTLAGTPISLPGRESAMLPESKDGAYLLQRAFGAVLVALAIDVAVPFLMLAARLFA